MDIEIEYCGIWNYLPNAASLAAELKESFQIDPVLNEGSGGVFLVTVNGNIVYNKKATGRFPDTGEVTRLIQEQCE
jgi:selenoprotein W-related protein